MTTATVDLVDAKDEAVKSELRLDMAQAVSDVVIALEKQGKDFRIALERQGSELSSAIERQNAILDQRLATAAYLIFGGSAVGHLATVGVVISLVR